MSAGRVHQLGSPQITKPRAAYLYGHPEGSNRSRDNWKHTPGVSACSKLLPSRFPRAVNSRCHMIEKKIAKKLYKNYERKLLEHLQLSEGSTLNQVCSRILVVTGWGHAALAARGHYMFVAKYCRYHGIASSEPLPKKVVRGNAPTRKPVVHSGAMSWRDSSRIFFQSDAWRKLRYKVLQKHGAKCQCCGARRVDGVIIHVDHIKPRYKFPELELVEENLQVLCEDCNFGKGAWDQTDWREAGVKHFKSI